MFIKLNGMIKKQQFKVLKGFYQMSGIYENCTREWQKEMY